LRPKNISIAVKSLQTDVKYYTYITIVPEIALRQLTKFLIYTWQQIQNRNSLLQTSCLYWKV